MKLTKYNLAKVLALATAILWVLCAGFVLLFSDFSHTVSQWWMHGVTIAKFNLSWGNFFWGGVSLVITMWIVGYVLGLSFDALGTRKNMKA